MEGTRHDPVRLKSDFIISLIEVTMNYRDGIDPAARSMIDEYVVEAYKKYRDKPCEANIPTFHDFYDVLRRKQDPVAHYLASGLEIYTEGSLNIFAEKSNVDIHNRLICFNTKNLGKQLKTMGMSLFRTFAGIWFRKIRHCISIPGSGMMKFILASAARLPRVASQRVETRSSIWPHCDRHDTGGS